MKQPWQPSPGGNPYLTLRDGLGTIFEDKDFADLYPSKGQPTISPWRLALITIMQFRENLSDRQAAEAVRSRIDWKYLLGLELTDPGFDFSVLSKFRNRLLEGKSETMLLDELLEACRRMDLVKPRGKQRTDATHVLAAVRVMNRLEQLAETMRAALNEIAAQAPGWLQGVAPKEWYKRYGRRRVFVVGQVRTGFVLLSMSVKAVTMTILTPLHKSLLRRLTGMNRNIPRPFRRD